MFPAQHSDQPVPPENVFHRFRELRVWPFCRRRRLFVCLFVCLFCWLVGGLVVLVLLVCLFVCFVGWLAGCCCCFCLFVCLATFVCL